MPLVGVAIHNTVFAFICDFHSNAASILYLDLAGPCLTRYCHKTHRHCIVPSRVQRVHRNIGLQNLQ